MRPSLRAVISASVLLGVGLSAALAAVKPTNPDDAFIEGLPDPTFFINPAFAGIVVGNTRTLENKQVDKTQRPVMLLMQAYFKPNSSFLEVLPEDSYWAEMLGKFLAGDRSRGKFIQAGDQSNGTLWAGLSAERDLLKDKYEVNVDLLPLNYDSLAEPNSVDLVLMSKKISKLAAANNLDRVAKAAFNALKPGGRLLVEDYRAAPDQQGLVSSGGYVNEDLAVSEIQKTGFHLERKNDTLLANANDTRSQTAPGSDRFVLVFQK